VSTVGVDFDGVIHKYSRGWGDGSVYDEPVDGAFTALHALMVSYSVFIHTSRDPLQVMAWIEAHSNIKCLSEGDGTGSGYKFWGGQGVLLVTNRKLPAVAYIDDRGIRFENWAKALDDLERFVR
jgi:hypothetical protein